MRAQRAQGRAFILCALAAILASLALPPMPQAIELLAVAAAVLVLGVPHGALDPLFMRGLPGAGSLVGWAAYGLGYAGLALAVVGFWAVAPAAFLAGFLLISAVHFSGDPAAETSWLSRVLYGGAIIVLPALLHGARMEALFAELAGSAAAASLMPALRAVAGPWLALLLLCAAAEARRDRLTGAEMAALAGLAAVAPPLVAFAVFFCAMHSPRHMLRAARVAPPRALWAAGLVPMLLVLILAGLAWRWFGEVPAGARGVRIIFLGLAALTVPHMVLVDRVRLAKGLLFQEKAAKTLWAGCRGFFL